MAVHLGPAAAAAILSLLVTSKPPTPPSASAEEDSMPFSAGVKKVRDIFIYSDCAVLYSTHVVESFSFKTHGAWNLISSFLLMINMSPLQELLVENESTCCWETLYYKYLRVRHTP